MCIAQFTPIISFLSAFALLFSMAFGASEASALPAQNVVAAIKKLEANIESHVQKKAIPGCAVAVVYQNQIIFLRGYGVRTLGRPEKIDVDTIFQLGSVSK